MNVHVDMGECPRACERGPDAVAYALGELGARERERFESHAEDCEACARTAAAARALAARLREAPAPVPGADLADRVLARVAAGDGAVRGGALAWPGVEAAWIRAAAGIVLALGLAAAFMVGLRRRAPDTFTEPAAPAVARERACAWLRQTQNADGGWSAGHARASEVNVGVSALALLALMEGAGEGLAPETVSSIRRGLDFLVGVQDEQGLFGPRCAVAPYNQGLAALALIEGCALDARPSWREAAERGLRFIVKGADSGGGWTYLGAAPGTANTSISVWPILALSRADAAGFADLEPALKRGLAWLSTAIGKDGRMGYRGVASSPYGYHTLTAAGAVCMLEGGSRQARQIAAAMLPAVRRLARDEEQPTDFYRSFFVAAALGLARDPSSDDAVLTLKDRLLARQRHAGPAAGSWPAEDQWSAVGGPVYATALASLALR